MQVCKQLLSTKQKIKLWLKYKRRYFWRKMKSRIFFYFQWTYLTQYILFFLYFIIFVLDVILLKSETIVSLISAGVVAVLIALASWCFKHKRKAENLKKSRSKTINRYQLSIEREHDRKNIESAYDLIDYSVINNDSLIRIVTSVPIESYNQVLIIYPATRSD